MSFSFSYPQSFILFLFLFSSDFKKIDSLGKTKNHSLFSQETDDKLISDSDSFKPVFLLISKSPVKSKY